MRDGFNLIEVLIACTLLVFAIAPLAMLYRQSQRQTSSSLQEIQAAVLGRELIQNLQNIHASLGYDEIRFLGSRDPERYTDLSAPDRAALYVDPKDVWPQVSSKLVLTPLPAGFRRLIRVYPANASPSSEGYNPMPDVKTVEVRIEWMAPLTQTFNRHLLMQTQLERDEALPPKLP